MALLVGERVPVGRNPELSTTSYFSFRACRAVALGVGGHLSGPFERLEPEYRTAAIEHLLALPEEIGLPDPRQLVPVMVEVHSRHPHLNLLNTEAVAAALLLNARMLLTPPTASGQLAKVLTDEDISFMAVELP